MADVHLEPPRSRAPSNARLDVNVNVNHTRARSHSQLDAFSPVNTDGCFEFDRVIKSGFVEKRTQKTKVPAPRSTPDAPFQ